MTASNDRTSDRHRDSRQLVRQWALLRLLSEAPRPYGVKQLSEQLGVSKATIERDLATLEREFAIVEESAGKQKRTYRIDRKVRALEAMQFGISELLAIYASQAMLASLSGTPLHDDLRDVMRKIRGALGPDRHAGLDALSRVFAPHVRGYVDYGPQHELLDDITDAIARRLVCQLTYHAAWKGTIRRHKARPLRLVWHRSSLYLLACLGEHQRVTTLAVHRIRDAQVTRATFAPPRVDVDGHIAKAFGIFVSDQEEDVEILFDPEIAWHVEERTFHPDEHKERRPDGVLRYSIRTSAQWEIIPWVLSFGAQAELVAPASWRSSVRTNAEAMLARYAR